MSPNGRGRSGKNAVGNNIYTVILALALCAVVATAVFVTFKCLSHYETVWSVSAQPMVR